MINRISEKLTNYLAENDNEINAEKELFMYAFNILVINYFPLLISVVLGLCCAKLAESVMLVIPFLCLRKYCGGYHSKHLSICLTCSIFILGTCIMATELINNSVGLFVFTLIECIGVYIISPIENANKRISKAQKMEYKKKVLHRVILFESIFVSASMFKKDTVAVCVAIGITLSFFLQIPCIFEKIAEKINKINGGVKDRLKGRK